MGYCTRKEIETLGGRLMMGQGKEIIKKCFSIVFIGRVLFVTIFIDTIFTFSGDFSKHAAIG